MKTHDVTESFSLAYNKQKPNRVLFTSERTTEREMNRRICAAFTVLCTLCRSFVVKKFSYPGAAAPPHREEPIEVVQGSGEAVLWMLREVLQKCPTGSGPSVRTCWGVCLLVGLGTPCHVLEELAGEREVWGLPAQAAAHATWLFNKVMIN